MPLLPWLAVALFAAFVAIGELVARFRDAPARLLRSPLVWLYCSVNALAALLAFALLQTFEWTGGVAVGETQKVAWLRIITAGFSSMFLLRSSLFRLRVGSQDIDVGPAALVQQLQGAIDREIDRQEGQLRLLAVDALKGLRFEDAVSEAPALCAGVLQSLTSDQQAQLKKSIEAITGGKGSEESKLRMLALELMNVAGPEIVKSVADKLRAGVQPPLPGGG